MRLRLNRAYELISKFNAEIQTQKDIVESKIKDLDDAAYDADLEREQLELIEEFLKETSAIQERLEIIIR